MLSRFAYLMADVQLDSPSFSDAAAIAAAVFFGFGFVAFLRGHRLAVYALILDAVGARLCPVSVAAR